ncbi:MAG: HDIG domain-containing protein [Deltaproteobacteria bacterium]|nr:HDIG domain-containing protein [Deltaproteobacteria bacterium]
MLRTRLRAGSVTGVILAVTFAFGFVFIANVELFFGSLRAQPGEPAPVTVRIPYSSVFATTEGEVRYFHRGVLLPRGREASSPTVAAQVEAFERARRPPQQRPGIFIGLYFLYMVVGLIMAAQLRRLGGRGALLRTQLAIFCLLLIFMAAGKAFLLLTSLPELYLPMAALPLWTSLFVDRRAAIVMSIGLALAASSLLGFDILLVGVLLTQGTVAALLFRDRRHPRGMIGSGLQAGVVAAAVWVAAMLFFGGRFDVAGDLRRLQDSGILSTIVGGGIAGLVAMVLAPLAGRVLGGVSRGRLLELAELDQPLLQRMATEAPGSFAHARAMANLAEAAAQAIEADALLVRVGAYYHDLGKTVQPKYYIENLEAGETSPHDDLEPDVSADAIMAHVVEGTKILRRGGIPEPVVEFSYTHHGTSAIEYFWSKCLEQGNPKNLTVESFRYPGMKPQTKETAILMIVDAIEATSRTIQPPTREGFEQAIFRTTYSKIRQAQLDESGLTIADIHRICDTLVETLVSAAHGRIAYPWQKEQAATPANGDGREPTPAGAGASAGTMLAPAATAVEAVEPAASAAANEVTKSQ